MGRPLWLLCILAGCYSAHATEGLPCSETMQCPDGQTCDPDTLTCGGANAITNVALEDLSAGTRHTCGKAPDSSLWCWGDNTFGELGVGDADVHLGAVQVGTLRGWVMVSSGDDASCAIYDDGSLWCWGAADVIGTQSNRPVEVMPGKPFLSVSVGLYGYCAIDAQGAPWCNWNGTLEPAANMTGDGTPVVGVQVAASARMQCVLDAQKRLFCWGDNSSGPVGNGTSSDQPVTVPYQVPGTWNAVTTSGYHTCATTAQDELYCWGACNEFQATGTTPPDSGYCINRASVGLQGATLFVDATGWETCAISGGHQVVCFGANDNGQLGRPTREPFALPGVVNPANDYIRMTAGDDHGCAISSDGTTWCWGDNRYGQLGNGKTSYTAEPVSVGTTPYERVSAGFSTTCAVTMAHTLECWGNDAGGQAGGNTGDRVVGPRQVGSDSDWFAVAVGETHTCGLRGTPGAGTLYCWGSNVGGALGTGSVATEQQPLPTKAGTFSDWSELAAGPHESCGVRAGGQLWCWGWGAAQYSPLLVDAGPGWHSLTGIPTLDRGSRGIEALRSDGLPFVYSSQVLSPVTGPALAKLSRGLYHHCGIDGGGQLWCWGYNEYGQAGGPLGFSNVSPSVVGAGMSWQDVEVGDNTSCAITTDHRLFCFGKTDVIGSATVAEEISSPTEVVHAGGWAAVSVSAHHACAIANDTRQVYCWGSNANGELGTGPAGVRHAVRVHKESDLQP